MHLLSKIWLNYQYNRNAGDKMTKELFLEFDKHLINDEKPSKYFNDLISNNKYPKEYPFDLLSNLIKIDQNPKYHPEGNVWNHTMQVVDNGAKYSHLSTNKRVLMWSALLHDIGKGTTTQIRKGRITSYNHEKEGEKLAKEFLRVFDEKDNFVKPVTKLVRWHMEPFFINKNLPYSRMEYMVKEVPLGDISVLSLCDRLGRGEIDRDKELEEIVNLLNFINKCYEKHYLNKEDPQMIKILEYLSKKIKELESKIIKV